MEKEAVVAAQASLCVRGAFGASGGEPHPRLVIVA
jgi:hypothetical protein